MWFQAPKDLGNLHLKNKQPLKNNVRCYIYGLCSCNFQFLVKTYIYIYNEKMDKLICKNPKINIKEMEEMAWKENFWIFFLKKNAFILYSLNIHISYIEIDKVFWAYQVLLHNLLYMIQSRFKRFGRLEIS